VVLRCREGRTFQGVNIVARRVLGAVAVGVADAAQLRPLHLMNRRTVARWAVAVLLLAGCSIKGGSDSHGTPTFPPPGPLPPVGTAWQTEDGSAVEVGIGRHIRGVGPSVVSHHAGKL